MTSILKVRICLFVENRKGKKGYFGTKNIYVYICLIHVAVQQKLIHHCKMIILQLKKNKQPVQVTEIGNRNFSVYTEKFSEIKHVWISIVMEME